MALTDLSQLCVLLTLGFNLGLVQSSFFNVDVVYEITLDVFSGRSDPHWKIDKTHPNYNAVAQAVNNGPPTDMDRHLGYAGFMVNARNAFGQTAWKTVGRHTNRQLESLLLDSCPSLNQQGASGDEAGDNDISQAVINHVRAGIYGQLPVAVREVKTEYEDGSLSEMTVKHTVFARVKRQVRGICSTVFTPSNWNYAPVQRRNNCYNYASNLQTNTFAQPGRGSGRRFRFNERNEVYNACRRDGFAPLSGPGAGSNCLIALVIWPGEDYHFYRMDADRSWSHKSGQTRARNTDESGRRIFNPERADRGPYRVFGGYLGVTPNVNIR